MGLLSKITLSVMIKVSQVVGAIIVLVLMRSKMAMN